MSFKKIKAAGDDDDGEWQACPRERLEHPDLEAALELAISEMSDRDKVGIFQNGPDWTRLWYQLRLSRSEGSPEYIRIGEYSAETLIEEARHKPQAFDLLEEIYATQIEADAEMPRALRKRLIDHFSGVDRMVRPKGKFSDPDVWARRFMINHVAGLLKNLYNLERKRNISTVTIAASDVIYHALSFLGEEIKFGTIQNAIYDPEKCKGAVKRDYEDIRMMVIDSQFDDDLG